jgi:hypothetical protein
MATDYDAPRRGTEEEETDESVEQIRARRAGSTTQSPQVDADELDAESVELPGADLSGEELTVRVLPQQADEFICAGCFLVIHRSRRASGQHEQPLCRDCA